MSQPKEKYSRLGPISLEKRIAIARAAVTFFHPVSYRHMCAFVGKKPDKGVVRPFTTHDFLDFLSKSNFFPEAERYQQRVRELLQRMVLRGILLDAGISRDPIFGRTYYAMRELTQKQEKNWLWLGDAVGKDYIPSAFATFLVHITGKSPEGDVHAGTGLLLESNVVLTCAHVLTDMRIDPELTIQGKRFKVGRIHAHDTIDVGLIEIEGGDLTAPSYAFHEPQSLDELYVMGFPKIPFTRSAALIVHRGEVTNPHVTTLNGQDVFLYSAIARPGNSGGPIISNHGYVLGLVTQDLVSEESEMILPFYAGVPMSQITKAVEELIPGFPFRVEDYN